MISGRSLVPGEATATMIVSDVPLSFMGGVDPVTGRVIDAHHPLHGTVVSGRILAIPSGRGSCSGSGVIVEMLLAGTAPAALVFGHDEAILTLGVMIADELLDRRIPVLQVNPDDFARLGDHPGPVRISGATLTSADTTPAPADPTPAFDPEVTGVALSDLDRRLLAGAEGPAAQVAMRLVIQAAALEGAASLIDIEQGHVDGVFYQGPASLRVVTTLRDLGGRVRVPTTMNALCVDRQRWRDQGVAPELGEPSDELADAYGAMGLTPSYTCAPYCLEGRPTLGQRIGWAESNAVAYANSVLGARTLKLPDYLDLLIAITGRAPDVGTYRDEGRRATVRVDVVGFGELRARIDDGFFAALGHHVGELVPHGVPVVCGLERAGLTTDDLKTFSAAFATTSAAPMFHVAGVTPEAPTAERALGGTTPERVVRVDPADLAETWRRLDQPPRDRVDLVALGNPHLSATELAHLGALVEGRTKAPGVAVVVTCGRDVHAEAERNGDVQRIERFGGTVINDTCWCFMTEPVVPVGTTSILTNSGKYAHYGPAVVDAAFHLRGMADCIEAATTGRLPAEPPPWLRVSGEISGARAG